MDNTKSNIKKVFTWEDLEEYVQQRTSKEKGVVALRENKWTLVEKTQMLLKEVHSNCDEAYALIVTCPHNPWLNWIILPVTKLLATGQWVLDWTICPDTEAMLNVFYEDGNRYFLMAQIKQDN